MLHRLSLLLLLLCSAIEAPYPLVVFDMKAWGILRHPLVNGNGYVKVYCNNRHIGTTEVKNNIRDPVWDRFLAYDRARHGNRLKFKLFDKDIWQDKLMGYCVFRIKIGCEIESCTIANGTKFEYYYVMGG